jgi:hypothetical protein
VFPCTTEDVHTFIDLLRYYLMESIEQMTQRLGYKPSLALFLSNNSSLAQIMLDKFYPKPADRQQLVVLLDLSVKLQKSFTTLPYKQLYALHIKRLRQK